MKIFRLALMLALCCVSAFGQMTTARLVGTISDPSGAVISKANVTVTNTRTGESRTVTTNDSGLYIIPSLVPSEYTVKVSASGFSDAEARGIVLAVGQELVKDMSLPLAGSNTEVMVDAGQIVALDTSSARIGANVASREIEDLPINGRQVSQLYLLAPGATNVGSGNFGEIRFSGRAVEQNILRLDGVEATAIIDAAPGNLNGESNSIFRLQQSLEAIQEFRIDSNSYPAEMGTGTGGQISFVTKSGGNILHGSVFEYLRNDFFDARNTFNRKNVANNTPKFRLNQFGGSVGGPIIKDKLFFFGVYEGLRQRWAVPAVGNTLSNYTISRIPQGSPIRNLVAAFPVDPNPINPNVATVAVTRIVPYSLNENFVGARFDYHINDKYSLYARFNRDQGTSLQTQDAAGSQYVNKYVPQNAVIALNQVHSSNIFNETKIGYNYAKTRVNGVPGPSPNADLSATLINITNVVRPGGLVTLSSSFTGRGAPYTADSISPIDNLSIIKGNHNMKFGFEARFIHMYNDQLGGTQYSFNSVDTFINNLPDTTAFNGDLSAPSPFSGLSGEANLRQNYYIGYAQDEWKITPRLTLSYGLRYEYFQPLHEVNNKFVVFDMSTGSLFSNGRILPNYPRSWFASSTKNLGPRVGLTWAPEMMHGNTVFRVGGGIFYGPGQTEDQIQPEANDRVGRSFTAGAQPYPVNAANLIASYNINNPTLGFQPRAYAPNYRIPERIGTYTVSVQQQLPAQFQFMVGYVGSVGRNLFLRSITNRITSVTQAASVSGSGVTTREFGPRFGEIDYKTSGGTDRYDALQTTLQRRFRSGLSMGAQYTWAKELGTSSGSNEASTAQNPYDFNMEYGRGNFDIRHSLNATLLYDLPIGRGKAINLGRAADLIAGGWQLGGIVNFRGGLPIDVLITRPDIAYVGQPGTPYAGNVYASPVYNSTLNVAYTRPVINVPGGGNTRNIRRVNLVPGVDPYTRVGKQLLNPAAFTTPAPGTFGTLRRNALNGPTLTQLDMTLEKGFAMTERIKFDFKAEVFNVLNHPNYAVPGTLRLSQGIPNGGNTATTSVGAGLQPGLPFSTATAGTNFGAYTSTVGNQVGTGANRQIQLSGRINF